MIKKIGVFVGIMVLMPLVAGIYGILHDQITYTIAPEYFTKFKFYQFNMEHHIHTAQRVGAMYVGFFATWWMGIPIGLFLGMIAFAYPDSRSMWLNTLRAILVCMVVTILTPCIGVPLFSLLLGAPQNALLPAFVPEGIVLNDKNAYALVGMIHNFSYLGGVLGVAVAMFYQARRVAIVRRLYRAAHRPTAVATPSAE